MVLRDLSVRGDRGRESPSYPQEIDGLQLKAARRVFHGCYIQDITGGSRIGTSTEKTARHGRLSIYP